MIASRYDKLLEYIKDNNKEYYKLSFDDIENILGFKIDHSFLNCKKELFEYGYVVKKISLKEKYVEIDKLH